MLRIEAGDEFLKSRISGNRNATYMSPRIQNELIDICGKILKSLLTEDIKNAAAYSVLADETADLWGKSSFQLALDFSTKNKKLSAKSSSDLLS